MSRYTSDQSLAEGLHAGRRDACERLYDEQHAAIYNLCARILGDREEAADVTHDTFITAFSKPPAVTPDVKLRPWLYRVATNACFNRIRARRQGGGDGEAIAALPDRVDEYQRAETVALVEATLAELNERYRTALVLKDLHGLPAAEIADVMEVSRPAADVLVHRARHAFKAAFARLGGSSPAPADLGLVLAPLGVPAALHLMPPLPHPAPPLPHPAVPPHPQHLVPHVAGPGGAGLLSKIGAALTTKAAVGVAAAALVVGGGVVAVRDVERHEAAAPGGAAATKVPPRPTAGTFASRQVHLVKTRWGCLEWHTRHDLHDIEQWCADRAAAGHHTEAAHGDDAGTGHTAETSHDGGGSATATGDSHAGDDVTPTAAAAHDGSTDGGTTSATSGSHDSADGGSTHDVGDGGSHE